jgi:hypothetical protein
MRCGTARSWIEERRDAELGAARQRELTAHLAGCADCAGYARDTQEIGGLLGMAPVEEPSAKFDWVLKLRLARIDREGSAELQETTAPSRSWLQFGAAAVVASLAVVAAGTLLFRSPRPDAPSPVMQVAEPQIVAPQPGAVIQPVVDLGPGSRANFVGPLLPESMGGSPRMTEPSPDSSSAR